MCVCMCVCMCACVHCLAMGARSSIFFAELALVFSVVLCHGYGHHFYLILTKSQLCALFVYNSFFTYAFKI